MAASIRPLADGPIPPRIKGPNRKQFRKNGKPILPHSRYWPRLDEETQRLMLAFLGDWREKAHEGYSRALELKRAGAPAEQVDGILNYWERVCQAIDWLASNVPHRQRFLALERYQRIHGEMPP